MTRGLQDQVRVVQVDPLANPRWGSFVAEQPSALIYHDPAWLSALEREYQGGSAPAWIEADPTAGRMAAVVGAVWRRLPLWATARLGDWWYRYL